MSAHARVSIISQSISRSHTYIYIVYPASILYLNGTVNMLRLFNQRIYCRCKLLYRLFLLLLLLNKNPSHCIKVYIYFQRKYIPNSIRKPLENECMKWISMEQNVYINTAHKRYTTPDRTTASNIVVKLVRHNKIKSFRCCCCRCLLSPLYATMDAPVVFFFFGFWWHANGW